MSDVAIAPAAPTNAPANQPAPAANEVPINQNPVAGSNPVGSQAPQAPTGDFYGSRHRPPSRSEAIKAAFDRANSPPPKGSKVAEKPAPKPAEAKAGHNNPPEETPKLDLRKRPDDQPQSQPRERGDGGRFAPKSSGHDGHAQNAQNAQMGTPNAQQGQPARKLPPGTPYADAPARFSEAGKRDWAATPDNIRADVHRMQTDFVKAYNFYKDAHENFKPVKHFHEMAKQHGTTLERALTNYVGMEQKLRADPIAGLDQIVNNLGLKTPDGQRIGLRDIAYHVLSQSPEQLRQLQMGNQQQAASHQIGALHQEIAGLKNTLQQMHNQQQFTYTRSAVDQFADSHPRFDEIGDLIQKELELGFDLETAYRRAELLRPATHAAQTRTASAQTRPTDRSIYGAPDVTASNAASRPRGNGKVPDRRTSIENAFKRAGGGL
jgi:hypothetical protein